MTQKHLERTAQAKVIKGSDIKDLVNLFDICQAARDAAYGVVNRPRCREKTLLVIEEFVTNRLDLLIDPITTELERRKPKTMEELEWRDECLCSWAMMCGSFTDATRLHVELVSNEQSLPERVG